MCDKKAVIIGGSNGIGLAIARQLMLEQYHVIILDICEPDLQLLPDSGNYSYFYFNMMNMDEERLIALSKDSSIDILMVTAGIGRVAYFENLHFAEIEKTMVINATAVIKTIKVFYPRISRPEPFYCGIMGSISGMISSPLFSVYAASKAAVFRFVESLNVELEHHGTQNRVLNVSPGVIKGTRFAGGTNNLSDTMGLARDIISRVRDQQILFIPAYEEVYKDVLTRYHTNPQSFGISSLTYKLENNRLDLRKGIKVGYLSGTFDLYHIGHLNLIKRAKQHCDYLIVGVHIDASHKNAETFIPFEERLEIISSCKYVDKAVQSCREDSDAWDLWKYDCLFVGSDYKGSERFKRYEEYLKDKRVDIVYLPYTQGTSSTQIRHAVTTKIPNE